MKENKDNTSYTNYQKDGPNLKIVQQAQQEMIQKGGKEARPTPIERPAVTIRRPKPGKPYNV